MSHFIHDDALDTPAEPQGSSAPCPDCECCTASLCHTAVVMRQACTSLVDPLVCGLNTLNCPCDPWHRQSSMGR